MLGRCEKFLIEVTTVVAVNNDSPKRLTPPVIIDQSKTQLPHNDFLKEIMAPSKVLESNGEWISPGK